MDINLKATTPTPLLPPLTHKLASTEAHIENVFEPTSLLDLCLWFGKSLPKL